MSVVVETQGVAAEEHRSRRSGGREARRAMRAAPLADVIRYIEGCLWLDYDQPENVLFLDKESETGFAGDVLDSQELLFDHLAVGEELFDAILAGFDPDLWWCEADPAVFLPDRHLQVSWESFCSYVKHTSRFMFMRHDEAGRRLFDEQDHTLVRSTEMLDPLPFRSAAARRSMY